jgi:hypothetical protein
LSIEQALGRSRDVRELQRRSLFSVVRRTNMRGPSRSAIAGLELIISSRDLTSVQLEPNLCCRSRQPATIIAKKATGLAIRCHDFMRSASRDRAGILCPYAVAGMGT